uniref:Uncharacterized protein n=1 Tax=Mycena chlorophos TaxID=658473 RepID=A0ABQ0M0Q6_MYCCL|nr:predicted protein [Mycena chlorophos]
MRFNLAALIVASAVGIAQAYDFRLLYALPSGDDMVEFTVDFGNACAHWAPALAANLTFEDFNVLPGDYHGNNTETEAKIYCVWNQGGNVHEPTAYTKDVAASLGATPVSD